MNQRTILVVDDEPNTRVTLEHAIEPMGYEVVLAASGEEALDHLAANQQIGLVLLDLKLPGLDGLEVLRRIEQDRPDARVVILTAHGTVDTAVEGMKHGAFDLLQKPVSLEAIRAIVRQHMDSTTTTETRRLGYETHVREARTKIHTGSLDAALAHARQAEKDDPGRPEAYNLIGVIEEMRQNRVEAQRQYRMALEVDPTYRPARENLQRSTSDPTQRGPISLGDPERE